MTIGQRLRALVWGMVALVASGSLAPAMAAEVLKPYVLGSKRAGDPAKVLERTKEALLDGGFEIVGEYAPNEASTVLVATNGFLKDLVAKEKSVAYLVGIRVGITHTSDEVQVSYMNPDYWRYAYRIDADLGPVTAKLAEVLGAQQPFGAKGMSPRKLKKYHYTFGMEYFDDPMEMANHGSFEKAVATVEKNLASGVAGASKVYRVDIPGKRIAVFGVAMSEGMSSDAAILEEVDARPLKHVAHVPYELVVFGDEVRALHPRFRIAISWPDLKMVGDHSFFGITRSPEAIKEVLTRVAGGEYDSRKTSGGFSIE